MWNKYRETDRLTPLAGLLAGLLGQPLSAATEELTVYGGAAAAEVRQVERELDFAMETYVHSVGTEFRAALALELRKSIAPDVELAARKAKPRLM